MKTDINLMVLGRAVNVLGALNSRTRVRIVQALCLHTEMTVSEMVNELRDTRKDGMRHISKTAISNHLKQLRVVGLIYEREKQEKGRGWETHVYTCKMERLESILKYANALAAMNPGGLGKEQA